MLAKPVDTQVANPVFASIVATPVLSLVHFNEGTRAIVGTGVVASVALVIVAPLPNPPQWPQQFTVPFDSSPQV